METTIYFVRHGKVESKGVVYARLPGFGLSTQGFQQARAAAEALHDIQPTAIYCSPMLRTRQTAHIIGRTCPNVKIRITHLINETYIPFDGWSFEEMEKRQWDVFTGTQPPYEQPADLVKRMVAFIAMARQAHPGQQIIAVSHGDPIAWLIKWALGIPLLISERNNQYPTEASITRMVFSEPGGAIKTCEQIHPRA